MLSIDDLHAAGERAAARPVAPGPAVETLHQEVARRQYRRRGVVAVSAVVVTALAGVATVALIGPSDGPVAVITADQPDGADANASTTSDGPRDSTPAPAAVADGHGSDSDRSDDDSSGDEDGTGRHGRSDDDRRGSIVIDRFVIEGEDGALDLEGHLVFGGDVDLSIKVIEGDEAQAAAAEAAERADETRTVDDVDLWIDRDDDRVTISALVEPDEFVEVTGPADLADGLSAMVTQGGLVTGHDDLPAGLPPLPELRDLVPGELLDRLEDGPWFGSHDSDEWPRFSDDLDHLEDLDAYLEERFGSLPGAGGGCARIEIERSDSGLHIELPGCDSDPDA